MHSLEILTHGVYNLHCGMRAVPEPTHTCASRKGEIRQAILAAYLRPLDMAKESR